jgi:hypothetical protein
MLEDGMTLEMSAGMTRLLLVASLLAAAACNRSSASPAKAAPAAAPPAAAAAPLGKGDIEVVVNGKPGAWTQAQIEKAGSVAMTNQNGEERQGWPLKAVAKTLVGGNARVVAVANTAERVAIDEKQWNDQSLVLRLNHHGEYKAMWVDSKGNSDEAFLKGVRRVEVVQ